MSACSSGPTRDGLTVQDAVEINHRLHLSRSRKLADERVRKLGPGAKRWIDGKEGSRSVEQAPDIPTWYALILLEAFTLLREQFRFYPVKVLPSSSRADSDLVWLVPRDEPERDDRRKLLGLQPAAEALRRELRADDGRDNWTLTSFATLAGGRERLPDLSYERTGQVEGTRALAFATSEAVVPGRHLYLRPRKDTGFERAIRRRLQNIVASRTNVELLRALYKALLAGISNP
jgi:DNA polymerase alpha-associated DNA helicase A